MFGHLRRRFGRGTAIKTHLQINEINKSCLTSDICIFSLRLLRRTWPIIAIVFCNKTSRFFNPDRTPLLLLATFQSVQFIVGQSLTCNLLSTRSKGRKKVVVRVALSILAKSEQCDDRGPEPHTFLTAVVAKSSHARVELRYLTWTSYITCPSWCQKRAVKSV